MNQQKRTTGELFSHILPNFVLGTSLIKLSERQVTLICVCVCEFEGACASVMRYNRIILHHWWWLFSVCLFVCLSVWMCVCVTEWSRSWYDDDLNSGWIRRNSVHWRHTEFSFVSFDDQIIATFCIWKATIYMRSFDSGAQSPYPIITVYETTRQKRTQILFF